MFDDEKRLQDGSRPNRMPANLSSSKDSAEETVEKGSRPSKPPVASDPKPTQESSSDKKQK